jgi:hypothetical protein
MSDLNIKGLIPNDNNIELIDVSRIKTGEFQVRLENVGDDIEDLEESIATLGLMMPIGVARSKATEKSSDYDWELLWGQRRHYCFTRLNIEQIPARTIDKVLTTAEGKAISLNEGVHQKSFTTTDIWRTIEDLYFVEPDPHKIMKKTGIPVSLIRDTVQDQLAKRLNGGEEIWNLATLEDPKITKKQAIDIIYACRAADGVSVDVDKAKNFLSYFKKQDGSLRQELIKATRRNPGASVSDWIEFGEKGVINKNSPKLNLGLTFDIDDRLEQASNATERSKEQYALDSIEEALNKDGFKN